MIEDKMYVLKKGDYYLADIEVTLDDRPELLHFEVDKEFQKLFSDFDIAEEIRKIIFIETGLNFTVKLFKRED